LVTGSTTDNALARFDGTSGNLQNSSLIVDDSGSLTGVTQISVDNIRIDANTISSTNTNGDITITPNGTGNITLDGVNWPQADGSSNQSLITNGAGQASWSSMQPLNANLTEISTNMTVAEIQQLENINATTISTTQWGYLGGFNQPLKSTDDAQFNNLGLLGNLTVGGSITVTGTVDGVDVAALQADVTALQADVDGFPDELKNLTASEINQLENIGTNILSSTSWALLSNMNQDVDTGSSVTFNSLFTTTNAGIGTNLSVGGNITVTGTVDGVDVAALKTDVDGFP